MLKYWYRFRLYYANFIPLFLKIRQIEKLWILSVGDFSDEAFLNLVSGLTTMPRLLSLGMTRPREELLDRISSAITRSPSCLQVMDPKIINQISIEKNVPMHAILIWYWISIVYLVTNDSYNVNIIQISSYCDKCMKGFAAKRNISFM